MSEAEKQLLVARSLEDFHSRRARGEAPIAEDYSDPLGEAYDDFLDVLAAETALDALLEPPAEEALPRDFGPYTLLREIGRGAAGIVYEAVHRELGRREAVKILRTAFDTEDTANERFRREAKALARIEHPNVVEIFGAGEVEGRLYYAMALLEGPSLARLSRLSRGSQPIDPRELCAGLAGVADALRALHEGGVVHRDVKPSNIIVAPDGRMVLADFGLARAVGSASMTRTGQALGTPLYMSPEQMLGKRDAIDGRTDIYGLGATLYEVLAGQPVFASDDVRALLKLVISERPSALRKVAPHVPEGCDYIAMKALEKRRQDRYQTAAAMRDDLAACAKGERVLGRPVSSFRRGLRKARPYALPIAAALVLAVGLLIWWSGRPGTVIVNGPPMASILLDGVEQGSPPLSVSASPGDHVVKLDHELFFPEEYRFRLASRGEYVLDTGLPPARNDEDPATMKIVAEWNDLRRSRTQIPASENHRGVGDRGDGDYIGLVYPAGRVRMEDLGDYFLEALVMDAAKMENARLVFRRGDEEIYTERFVHESVFNPGRLSEELLAKIRPGDEIEWGIDGVDGGPFLTSFEVVPADPKLVERRESIARALARQGAPMRMYFDGLALLDAGLPYAAYRLAEAASRGERDSILPWAIMQEALYDLDEASPDAGILETAFATDVFDQVGEFPEELREGLIETVPAAR